MWTTICNKLRDEDEWDKQVSECVKRTAPNNIFLIPQSTVSLYEAFRTIRNTCAHGKSGTVSYFQVEHLWSFIQDNYLKFVVNGSMSGIVQMIEDHYNTSLTAVGTDPSYIVTNIQLGIKPDEIEDVLESLFQLCVNEKPCSDCFSNHWRQIDLWDKIIKESTTTIQEAVIKFMKEKHSDIIDEFVSRYSELAELFTSDALFVRKLWKEVIFTGWDDRNDGA